ncbi:hypothetical protein ES705_46924 [subsurface metagenome]
MKFLKNRRALSPVIAVILMFILILAAIAISLTFMGPTLSIFKDNSYNNSNHMYFISLDDTIHELINSPPPLIREVYIQQSEGSFFFDSNWLMFFYFREVGEEQQHLSIQQNVSRVIHKSTATADYTQGEHRYLIGPEKQDYLMINGSSKLYNEISVLNESRTRGESSFLYLSLYYRYSLNINYQTEVSTDTEIYMLDIVHVNLILNETSTPVSQKNIFLDVQYHGTRKTTYSTIVFNNDIYGEMQLFDDYGRAQTERPIYFPVSPNYSIHLLNIQMIEIDIYITVK